jgi:hypothetical protein
MESVPLFRNSLHGHNKIISRINIPIEGEEWHLGPSEHSREEFFLRSPSSSNQIDLLQIVCPTCRKPSDQFPVSFFHCKN